MDCAQQATIRTMLKNKIVFVYLYHFNHSSHRMYLKNSCCMFIYKCRELRWENEQKLRKFKWYKTKTAALNQHSVGQIVPDID